MGRIKGTSLIEVVRVLRKNREAAAALVPAELHSYLTERLLPSSWYPEEHHLALLLALGKLLGPLVSGNVWEFVGKQGAVKDFTGIYSSVVRQGDPWGSLAHLNVVRHIYRDSGRMELVREGDGAARVLLHDYETACPEVCGTVTGYLATFLELSGALNVHAELLRAPPSTVGPSEWRLRFEVPKS